METSTKFESTEEEIINCLSSSSTLVRDENLVVIKYGKHRFPYYSDFLPCAGAIISFESKEIVFVFKIDFVGFCTDKGKIFPMVYLDYKYSIKD